LLAVFSDLALLALVDEATGFQATRDREALQEMLDRFLRHELAAWAKRFPDELEMTWARQEPSAGCCVLYQGHCLRSSLRIAAFADPCIFWLQIARAPRLQHPTVMVVNSNDNVQLPPKLRKLRAISFRGQPATHFNMHATLHFAVQQSTRHGAQV